MVNEEIKKEKEFYLKQYKRAYKELQIECNNLKKLIETVDPLDIDFRTKVNSITDLKRVCDDLHFRIVSREFNP